MAVLLRVLAFASLLTLSLVSKVQAWEPEAAILPAPAPSSPGTQVGSIEPSEGTYLGGDLVLIPTTFADSFAPPLTVSMAGIEQQVVSVTSTEIVVRAVPLETVSCQPLAGPVVITHIESGAQVLGPTWTYLPPTLCQPAPAPCISSDSRLCLHDGRFSVETDWADFVGNAGLARVASASDLSGIFWFFTPDNWEVHTKVLDGCSQESSSSPRCTSSRSPILP